MGRGDGTGMWVCHVMVTMLNFIVKRDGYTEIFENFANMLINNPFYCDRSTAFIVLRVPIIGNARPSCVT